MVDARFMRTRAVRDLSARLISLLPGLVRHRCECGSPHGIEAELADTETAHALEHVTLEVMALAGSPRSLRGETAWDFGRDGRGVFNLSLEYDDPQVAEGALVIATAVLDAVCRDIDPPDIEGAVARLREQRSSA